MKFEFVQKIVDRIKQDITCPRCNKKCGLDSLDVCGIDSQNIEFLADCPHCRARVHISAELTIASNGVISKDRPRNHRLSVQKLHEMKEKMGSFKGDVRNLFNS